VGEGGVRSRVVGRRRLEARQLALQVGDEQIGEVVRDPRRMTTRSAERSSRFFGKV
jgi:hypothetical protein